MKKLYVLLIIVLLAGFLIVEIGKFNQEKVGSVGVTSEYNSTTTPYSTNANCFTLKKGTGTFGSLVLTSSPSWSINFYDATTSAVTLRAAATSSLPVLASFPASATVGTYTFDSVFYTGLLACYPNGVSTSTPTWR